MQLPMPTIAAAMPMEFLAGSADLTGSNLTQTAATAPLRMNAQGEVEKTKDGQIGRHINYGVREFGMAAAGNGVLAALSATSSSAISSPLPRTSPMAARSWTFPLAKLPGEK